MTLEELAEHLALHLPPHPAVELDDLGWAVLSHQRRDLPVLWATYRVRAEDVDRQRAEAHAWFAGRGRDRLTWWLGPSTRPRDLERRLVEDGAELHADTPLTGMVLTEEPPEGGDFVVRRVETFDDFVASSEISAAVFGQRPGRSRAELEEDWPRSAETGVRFLAVDGDRPVARGTAAFTTHGALALVGGATLPEERGRGAYTALVRARWDEAVRRGRPALVVQATRMSRPILERLGFRAVCELRLVTDVFG